MVDLRPVLEAQPLPLRGTKFVLSHDLPRLPAAGHVHCSRPECSLTGGPQAMAITSTTRALVPRPAKDEWGVYDPEQAGLAALFHRLEKKDDKGAVKPAPKLAERKDLPAPKTPPTA